MTATVRTGDPDELPWLAAIIDGCQDAIAATDLAGTITTWNRAAESMFGYPAAEAIGQSIELVVPSDRRPAESRVLEQLRHDERIEHFQTVRRRKDGSELPVSVTLSPIRTASHELIGISQIARDIAELKRNELAIMRASREAVEATRELESFSYSVAHDLRAPLRRIDGFSQVLVDDYGDLLDDDGKKFLEFVRGSAQHMARLIDDLFAVSRVARSEFVRESVDLSALALAAISQLQRDQPERVVDLEIAEGIRANGDPRLLRVVLNNLLGNAWKFTGKRERTRIQFGAAIVDGRRAYFVKDNGAGFDMNYVGKLFGLFQRLHAANEFDGTGAGLAIVQRIVRRHGGRVWAQGQVEVGATFWFTLDDEEIA